MTEKVLLNSGYKYLENEFPRNCDKFYQKSLYDKDTFENAKFINVYYYKNVGLQHNFEYEYVEERNHYWIKTYMWGIDNEIPYTIEEIENILKKEGNKNEITNS